MIVVTDPSHPLLYTAKHTIRRQVSLKEYADEVSRAYKAVAESSNEDISPPSSWELADVVQFVRSVADRVLERPVGVEDDLFQLGADRYVQSLL